MMGTGIYNYILYIQLSLQRGLTPETVMVKKLLHEACMMNIWRDNHPAERQFTFYSHPHSVHSRVDYFVMFNSDRHRIIKCEIGVKDIRPHKCISILTSGHRS